MSDQDRDMLAEAIRISETKIHPILAGLGPGMQQAIIVELLSTLLNGYPREARRELFEAHIGAMRHALPELD